MGTGLTSTVGPQHDVDHRPCPPSRDAARALTAARDAAQVFYHLGELDDALTYALGAGSLFDLTEQSEYVQTILGECGLQPCRWGPLTAQRIGQRHPSKHARIDSHAHTRPQPSPSPRHRHHPTARCIDQYTELRLKVGTSDEAPIDERLCAIIERMFDR